MAGTGSNGAFTGGAFGNSRYSAEDFQKLTKTLTEPMSQDSIQERAGPSGKPVPYVETWKAIELANDCFGFNGWSSQVMEIQQDFVDEMANGRVSVGCSAIIRVTLPDGVFHEDIGYGSSENQKSKGQALENSKKKAISDGVKRALRHFGHALGLQVYDKKGLKKIKEPKKPEKTMFSKPGMGSSSSTATSSAATVALRMPAGHGANPNAPYTSGNGTSNRMPPTMPPMGPPKGQAANSPASNSAPPLISAPLIPGIGQGTSSCPAAPIIAGIGQSSTSNTASPIIAGIGQGSPSPPSHHAPPSAPIIAGIGQGSPSHHAPPSSSSHHAPSSSHTGPSPLSNPLSNVLGSTANPLPVASRATTPPSYNTSHPTPLPTFMPPASSTYSTSNASHTNPSTTPSMYSNPNPSHTASTSNLSSTSLSNPPSNPPLQSSSTWNASRPSNSTSSATGTMIQSLPSKPVPGARQFARPGPPSNAHPSAPGTSNGNYGLKREDTPSSDAGFPKRQRLQ